jgi:rhamnosyltransferase
MPLKTKLDAAVVILYNPDNSVWDNIYSYIDYIRVLYIIDNSTISNRSLIEKIVVLPHVKLLHSGYNIGIAKALNLTLEHCSKDKHLWLMTMDQDTAFNTGDMSLFLENFYRISAQNVALFSPLHSRKGIQKSTLPLYVEKEYVMTSANIVNVKIAKKIGGYREDFFIDEIDHDFCFRLGDAGFHILQNASLVVRHQLGEMHQRHRHVRLYPSSRLYYMVRNYLYLKKEHQDSHQDFFKKRDKYLRAFMFKQIRYGENRMQNIWMILKGMIDYGLGKRGKLIDE